MGKKFNLYYEQLKEMMSGQPPKSLDEAMATLKAQQRAEVPEAPRGEEEQKRLDYALKCSYQIMDRAAEKIKKEAAWDAAVKQVSKCASNPGLTISKGTGDWLVSMMNTGDAWQDRAYNAVLAAQMAYCTGKIGTDDIFQTIQVAYDPNNFSKDFSNFVRENGYNAPKKMLEALDEKIKQGQRQLEELDSSADAILGGEASGEVLNKAFEVVESDEIALLQTFKGALDDIRGFGKTLPEKYPGKLPAEELDKREKEWQSPDKARIDSTLEKVEQVADLSYALWNQQAQKEDDINMKSGDDEPPYVIEGEEEEEEIKEEKQPPVERENEEDFIRKNSINRNNQERRSGDDELPYVIEGEEEKEEIDEGKQNDAPDNAPQQAAAPAQNLTRLQKQEVKERQLNEFLKPYGLKADDKFLRMTQADRTAYRKDTGEVIILRVTERETADGYKVEISDNAPGCLVNYDLVKRLRTAKDQIANLEVSRPHSKEYNNLEKRMKALEGLKFDDEPSPEQLKEAGNQFRLFKRSLEEYISLRQKFPEKRNDKNWYKGAIKDLRSLAGEKLAAIELVDNHISTKNSRELDGKELDRAVAAAQKKGMRKTRGMGLPDTYIETAMKWSKNFTAKMGNWENERITAAKLAREGIRMQTEGLSVFFQTRELSKRQDLQTEKFELKILLGQELWQMGCDQQVGPEELADTLAKSALACEVAKELVNLEKNLIQKGNPPIGDLINGGRLYDVVNMVKNSQSFGEHYRCLDLSSGAEAQMDEIRKAKPGDEPPAPSEVAKEIMKSYLAQQRQAAQNAKNKPKPAAAVVNHEINNNQKKVLQ